MSLLQTGGTALALASQNNHINVVQFLLGSGAQVNKVQHWNVLCEVFEVMWHSTVLTLQGKIPPLYDASSKGNLNIIEVLLDHGADVNQPTDVSNCLHNNSPHCVYVVIVVDKSCIYSPTVHQIRILGLWSSCGLVICTQPLCFVYLPIYNVACSGLIS